MPVKKGKFHDFFNINTFNMKLDDKGCLFVSFSFIYIVNVLMNIKNILYYIFL